MTCSCVCLKTQISYHGLQWSYERDMSHISPNSYDDDDHWEIVFIEPPLNFLSFNLMTALALPLSLHSSYTLFLSVPNTHRAFSHLWPFAFAVPLAQDALAPTRCLWKCHLLRRLSWTTWSKQLPLTVLSFLPVCPRWQGLIRACHDHVYFFSHVHLFSHIECFASSVMAVC